jgi:hypothetical protein
MKRGHRYLAAAVLSGAIAVAILAALAIGGTFKSTKSTSALREKRTAIQQVFDIQSRAQAQHPGWESKRPKWRQGRRWSTVKKPLTGIREIETPFPSSVYDISVKAWQRWNAGWLEQAYAGSFTQHANQGFIIVLTQPYPLRVSLVPGKQNLNAPDQTRMTLYKTPRADGKVRIVASSGDLIQVVSAHGSRWTFDLRSRRFQAFH